MRNRILIALTLVALGCSSDDSNSKNNTDNTVADLDSFDASVLDDLGPDDMGGPDAPLDMAGPEWDDLTSLLSPYVDDGTVPSMTAVVFDGDAIVAAGAAGLRKVGTQSVVTLDDKHYLASVSKPMLAVLAARLVDRGEIEWTSTVGDVFGFADSDTAYDGLTLIDILTHRAGFPRGGAPGDWETLGLRGAREQIAREQLSATPDNAVGEFSYSVIGYVVAAAMLEAAADKDWETMLQEDVFAPLGMQSCGLGHPADLSNEDQPWPHTWLGGVLLPKPGGDDWDAVSPTFFPSGGVHCSLPDVARFGRVFVGGNSDYLSEESLDYLLEVKTATDLRYFDVPQDHTGAWFREPSLPRIWHEGVWAHNTVVLLRIDVSTHRGIVVASNTHHDAAAVAVALTVQQLGREYF